MNRPVRDHEILSAVFAKMDVPAMSVAAGALCALMLFLATAILLLQTVPEGYPVGPHLSTLAHYLPGYEVSWYGALIGMFYGFLIGAIGGFCHSGLLESDALRCARSYVDQFCRIG
jgi:hypothetical protein